MRHIATALILTAMTACGTAPRAARMDSHVAAAQPDAKTTAKRVDFDTGTFKMYQRPDFRPDPACDVHVRLDLLNGFTGPLATLSNEAFGCAAPDEDHRAYNVEAFAWDACRSKVYRGKRDDGATLEVRDHRERSCGGQVPAKIVVVETFATGQTRTLYVGADQAIPSAVEGVMEATTNSPQAFALRLLDGSLVNLDLATNGLQNAFRAGERIVVVGFYQNAPRDPAQGQPILVANELKEFVIN